MGSVYKPTRTDKKTGKTIKYKRWYIAYVDESGRRQVERAFTDKDASKALLVQKEKECEQRAAGISVADNKGRSRPWSEALEAYLADIERQGLSKSMYKSAQNKVALVGRECGWRTLGAARPDEMTAFLTKRRAAGRAPRTLNAYLEFANSFLCWCVTQGWLNDNPLAKVRRARVGANGPGRRRAYTVQEVEQLLAVPMAQRLRDAYFMASLSGLRRIELRKLEVRDIDLSHVPPVWRLRREAQKCGPDIVLPIVAELVPTLKRLTEGRKKTERVFPGGVPAGDTMKKHLVKAKIGGVDEHGRHVNFHSFRYFFCSELAKRLPIQQVKVLMRHATIKRTCDLYMDLGLDNLSDAVLSLPAIFEAGAHTGASAEKKAG